MADKTNNILIGDVAIDVPAWASEITLAVSYTHLTLPTN